LVAVVRTATGNKGDAVFPRCVASFFAIHPPTTINSELLIDEFIPSLKNWRSQALPGL